MALLTINAVSFAVRDTKILDGLNFALAGREIHALLGANGTGKITLAWPFRGVFSRALWPH